MLCIILLHLFAYCITLIVVKPMISQDRAIINAFIKEYVSNEQD